MAVVLHLCDWLNIGGRPDKSDPQSEKREQSTRLHSTKRNQMLMYSEEFQANRGKTNETHNRSLAEAVNSSAALCRVTTRGRQRR